jgi:hypothetical protein
MPKVTHLEPPFARRLEAFSKELKEVGEGDVDAVYRARVASRRLRELLPLLELPRDQTQGLARRLRKATKLASGRVSTPWERCTRLNDCMMCASQ